MATHIVRFSYFGYTATFATDAGSTAGRRAQANAIILAEYGPAPRLSYVEPGVPFPSYVPCQIWDAETETFF